GARGFLPTPQHLRRPATLAPRSAAPCPAWHDGEQADRAEVPMTHDAEFPAIYGGPKAIDPVERAMPAMCYGVHVIGSHDAVGTLNAMIADWVMQVSFKPRLVACSVENDARTLRFIKATNAFSVN